MSNATESHLWATYTTAANPNNILNTTTTTTNAWYSTSDIPTTTGNSTWWNASTPTEVSLQLPACLSSSSSSSSSSSLLLQPLWDHLLLHHFSLVSSPFFPVLLAFSGYLLFSLPFAAFDLLGEERLPAVHRYKIQRDRRPTALMMLRSLGTAVYNHLVFVLPLVVIHGLLVPPPALPLHAPTVWQVFSGALGALLVFDAQYFIWHVVHHRNPHLYRWVHAVHHEYYSPFSWSTQQLSAAELMSIGFWSSLDPVLLGLHPLTAWLLTLFSVWLSVEDHVGYDLPCALHRLVPLGLLGGAPAHDMHHQRPATNFAPFFSHWDRLLGTEAHLEEKVIATTTTTDKLGESDHATSTRVGKH